MRANRTAMVRLFMRLGARMALGWDQRGTFYDFPPMQPLWGWVLSWWIPRVAPAWPGQPWAIGWNAVGVHFAEDVIWPPPRRLGMALLALQRGTFSDFHPMQPLWGWVGNGLLPSGIGLLPSGIGLLPSGNGPLRIGSFWRLLIRVPWKWTIAGSCPIGRATGSHWCHRRCLRRSRPLPSRY